MSPKTILVVDDDFALRRALCEALEQAGYRTIAAADGLDALRRLRGGDHADMILTDLRMPNMDGWAFLDELLKDPVLAPVPVIVASGGIADTLRSASLAAVEMIPKPFGVDAIVSSVQRHLAAH